MAQGKLVVMALEEIKFGIDKFAEELNDLGTSEDVLNEINNSEISEKLTELYDLFKGEKYRELKKRLSTL